LPIDDRRLSTIDGLPIADWIDMIGGLSARQSPNPIVNRQSVNQQSPISNPSIRNQQSTIGN
jgi:hypothetical protein